MSTAQTGWPSLFLPRAALADLIDLLLAQGYTVIGPVVRHGAIGLAPVTSADQLPRGVRDEQSAGGYRLAPGDPDLTFENAVGPESPKRFFFPPAQRLFQFHIEHDQFVLDAGPPQVPRLAFLGVRPCDLAAMRIHDRVFGADDPGTLRCESEGYYVESRRQALVIAINCTRPAPTCFCASLGTGPRATTGFDLALTELRGGFILTIGSDRGQELAAALPTRAPSSAELELAELKLHGAREHMGRKLDPRGLKEILDAALEHPQFDEIARRCLSCGNCTMVCPTCFCSTVTDATSLADARATRTRQWESCFTHQFTYTTAGPVRNTVRGRYRQWFRHKLCTWFDQFGSSGCVGCGRCISWCPVGIDITAEAARIRATSPLRDAVGQEVRA